jgi:hypothetical protein
VSLEPFQVGLPSSKFKRVDGSDVELHWTLEAQIDWLLDSLSVSQITNQQLFNKHLATTPDVLQRVGRYSTTLQQHEKIRKLVQLYAERTNEPAAEISRYHYLLENTSVGTSDAANS